jgi:excinuclease UvrABC nuclease subunit
MLDEFKKLAYKLPEKPGIYRFYKNDELLYIGKANSLKHRVTSYLQRVHNMKLELMLSEINHIEYVVTDSSVEALILEALEIQTKHPPLNIKLKDDRSFMGVYITKEDFPRIIPARLTKANLTPGKFYGPYTSVKTLKQALKIIRKIFSYCENPDLRKIKRPCFYYHLGQCPGVCVGLVTKQEYSRQIHHLALFLSGHKKQLLKSLKTLMNKEAKEKNFEQAALYKRQLDALTEIHDAKFELPDIGPRIGQDNFRLEGYDISNVSGKHASGSMVVMDCSGNQCRINTDEYRRFSIRGLDEPNDIKMMEEMLVRRLKHNEWPMPTVIQVDGGPGHVSMAKRVVKVFEKQIMVIGMAKGVLRKKSDLYGDVESVLKKVSLEDLITLRDESHRFAISGYRKRHRLSFLN